MRFRRLLLLLTLICLHTPAVRARDHLADHGISAVLDGGQAGRRAVHAADYGSPAAQGWELKVRSVPWVRVPLELASARAAGALICWPEEVKRFDLVASRPVFISELGFSSEKAMLKRSTWR
jgi:polar amino acid transport system substrate-binding protein